MDGVEWNGSQARPAHRPRAGAAPVGTAARVQRIFKARAQQQRRRARGDSGPVRLGACFPRGGRTKGTEAGQSGAYE